MQTTEISTHSCDPNKDSELLVTSYTSQIARSPETTPCSGGNASETSFVTLSTVLSPEAMPLTADCALTRVEESSTLLGFPDNIWAEVDGTCFDHALKSYRVADIVNHIPCLWGSRWAELDRL